MNLNELIKKATTDKNLRANLLADAPAVLAGIGIKADSLHLGKGKRFPEGLPQGGQYRP